MKRDAYGDDGPMQKRQRHSEEEITFLIPSKAAGSIIGKSGTNISKLRSQYKASITVPDCPGPERVLAISANDVDTILDIIKDILPNLVDIQSGQKGGDDDLDIRLLIHQSRAGCVIGKGGAKIKELREKTGARLKIFSNPAPQSTERVVQLVGSADCVADGIREVLDLVRQVPIKGPVQNYDPHNYDDYYAEEYGGFGNNQGGGGRGGRGSSGGGGGGRALGGGRGGHGGPPHMGPSRGSGGPRPMPMGRGPPPRSGMGDFGGPGSRSGGGGGGGGGGGFGGPPRGAFGGSGGGGGGFGGRDLGRGNFNGGGGGQQDTSTQVTIPTDLAGAIIGKGGSRIRKIRAESGAHIEIAQPLPGSTDRIITISGTPQRIQMAQYLLQQSVHESNLSHGRGNF